MGIFINILVLGIAFITFAIAGWYATNAAVRVAQIPDYTSDPNLNSGHSRLSQASVVTWISIALMILGIVLYIIFAFESVEFTAGYVIDALLFLSLAGCITVGILSSIGAYYIGQSSVSDNNGSYQQAIIASVLALVVAFLIIGGFILKIAYKPKSKEGGYGSGAYGYGTKESLLNLLNNPELAETFL